MSKKGKHKHHAVTSQSAAAHQPHRATRGDFGEQRLAGGAYKYEATPENKDRLLKIYLGRARQLRTTGYLRDAATVINAALNVDGADTAFLEQAAHELALCGDAGGTKSPCSAAGRFADARPHYGSGR